VFGVMGSFGSNSGQIFFFFQRQGHGGIAHPNTTDVGFFE